MPFRPPLMKILGKVVSPNKSVERDRAIQVPFRKLALLSMVSDVR